MSFDLIHNLYFQDLPAAVAILQAAEAKFRVLLESAPDAMFIVNNKGIIELVNKQAEIWFGYDRSELIGKPIEILVPKQLRERHAHYRDEYMQSSATRPMGRGLDLCGVRKDGSEFPVDISLSPVELPPGKVVIATLRDITERRRVEQERQDYLKREKDARLLAEEAVRARDEVMAILSHDLKNPLNGIMLTTSLIQRNCLGNERVSKLAESINRSAARMNHMVQSILDIHQMEEGKFALDDDRGAYDATSIVLGAIDEQKIQAQERDIKLEAELPSGLPLISVSLSSMERVFQNLVGNAIKFLPRGGLIRISASVAGQMLQFAVRDNGPGIEEELLPFIFDRFTQARQTAKLGTGLGLVIARGIIEAHGGKIWVDSKKDHGTTFYFTVPIAMSGALNFQGIAS